MKRLITFALALVCSMGMMVLAQEKSPYVVTLEHEGNLQTFYGPNGFQDAYNAASDGDVITLPAQTYFCNGITYKKALTIKGTRNADGYTRLEGSVHFALSDTSDAYINLEGLTIDEVVFDTSRIKVSKCWLGRIISETVETNPTIIRSRISGLCYGLLSPQIFNSVIGDARIADYQGEKVGTTTCMNCVFEDIIGHDKLVLLNCIVAQPNHNNITPFPSSATPINCLVNFSSIFYDIPNAFGQLNNYDAGGYFSDKGVYKSNTYYELSDEAKAKYLGDDGTEVGIYGGQYPYNEVLSTPTITNLNVSKRVAQGETLKIDVEAE